MPTTQTTSGAFCLLVAAGLLITGCAGTAPAATTTTAPSTPTATSSDVSPSPSDEGQLSLPSGASVSYGCTGSGTPAILLEAGTDTGGTAAYDSAFIDPLASRHRVCTYDRLGTGASDSAPTTKRTVDDLCNVQDQVRQALKLGKDTVLVGQSGGGNIAIWCAAQKPKSVGALVVIEAYHDDPKDLAGEGMRWDDNSENVDWVESSKMLDQMKMPIGTFPVLVISATQADVDGAKNQKYWLGLSKKSRQVVLDGGHNLHDEVPDKVVAEIQKDIPKT